MEDDSQESCFPRAVFTHNYQGVVHEPSTDGGLPVKPGDSEVLNVRVHIFRGVTPICVSADLTIVEELNQPQRASGNAVVAVSAAASVCACVSAPM